MDPEIAIEFARSKRPHISIYERQRQRILEFYECLKFEKQDSFTVCGVCTCLF